MAENFRYAEGLKPLQYYSLQMEDIGESVEGMIGTLQAKIEQNLQVAAVSAAEFFDKAVHEAIVQEARKAGVTDLVILDRDFVVDAIKRHLVHGRWVQGYELVRGMEDNSEEPYVACRICGHKEWGADLEDYTDYDDLPNYCPNCGAKMDGGKSDG